MSTTTARQEIAGNVRAILGKHKSNQTKIAVVLGMSQAAVSRRLSGETAFDTDELMTIAAHFNEPLSKFFEGVRQPSDQDNRRSIWEADAYRLVSNPGQLCLDALVAA